MIVLFLMSLVWAPSLSQLQLTILHTNDVHARIEQTDKNSAPCTTQQAAANECFGGVARIRTMVERKRASNKNVLLLDGGDQYQGTIWFSTFGGLATARFMNLVKYDVMSIGNHEFDSGIQGLLPFVHNVSFPLLSSNMNLDNTPDLKGLIQPSHVFTVDGQKIGVVGYTTTETSYISKPDTVTFLQELEAVQGAIDNLTLHGVNKIIALGHSGFAMDLELAKRLKNVDIVVGGHTNTFLYNGTAPSNEVPEGVYPTLVVNQFSGKNVLVVQDYAYGKYLGELNVNFDAQGQVTSWTGNPILLDKNVPQDNETLEIIQSYLPEIEFMKNTSIGVTNVDLMANRANCRTTECNLGNFITDAFLDANIFLSSSESWNNVSMAVTNAGSFRSSIASGPITIENVIYVQPFRNTLDIIVISGRTLLDMFELTASKWSTTSEDYWGGFLQVSGIKVVYDMNRNNGSRVVELKVTCTQCRVPELVPVQLDKEYSLVTSSFIYNGGDGFTMLPSKIIRKYIIGKIDTDVVINYIKKYQPIRTGLQGRISHLRSSNCPVSSASRMHFSSTIAFVILFLYISLPLPILQYGCK